MRWWCVAYPDGSCLHVRSTSEARARVWATRSAADCGAPAVQRQTVTADRCGATGAVLPVTRAAKEAAA